MKKRERDTAFFKVVWPGRRGIDDGLGSETTCLSSSKTTGLLAIATFVKLMSYRL